MKLTIRSSALDLLASREHTKFELYRKLISKGFESCDVVAIIQELEKQGLQSDERFVENYIIVRSKRGFGPLRIEAELCERGVDKVLINRFLLDYKSVWIELAENARSKKFGCKVPSDMREQVKQMRYLYYKGFDSGLIRKLLDNR